jgi:Bacterial regulatory helix-turn-helix protein, lysR family
METIVPLMRTPSLSAPPLAPSDLQDIAYFVEVARALSFTRASKASGIPIATLSRRVALMEKRTGVGYFSAPLGGSP